MKTKFKRLLSKRNKGGFTLVEVVISVALLSILVLGVMSFAGPVMELIAGNQKAGRATMLAETINSYIEGCLKSAKYVQPFENVPRAATYSGALVLKASTDANTGLNKFNTFMKTDPDAANYEVRCIGIRWLDDATNSGKQKLMLTNEVVDNNFTQDPVYTLSIKEPSNPADTRKVFDDVMYKGLYPVIHLENFTQTSSSVNALGYKVVTKVYTDEKCYNATSELARKKSHMSFEGSTYVNCGLNMNEPAFDVKEINDLQSSMSAGTGYTDSSGTKFFYPDTYIYYIAPKEP